MVTDLDICLLVWLYNYWFVYVVIASVIWLLDRLYGYWFGYIVTGSVIW